MSDIMKRAIEKAGSNNLTLTVKGGNITPSDEIELEDVLIEKDGKYYTEIIGNYILDRPTFL